MTDFERGVINSYKNVFMCKMLGCFFHYGQCLFRNFVRVGLKKQYSEDENLLVRLRKFTGETKNKVIEWLEYYENTWFADSTGLYAKDALFRREEWNQFENDGPRTNNNG